MPSGREVRRINRAAGAEQSNMCGQMVKGVFGQLQLRGRSYLAAFEDVT